MFYKLIFIVFLQEKQLSIFLKFWKTLLAGLIVFFSIHILTVCTKAFSVYVPILKSNNVFKEKTLLLTISADFSPVPVKVNLVVSAGYFNRPKDLLLVLPGLLFEKTKFTLFFCLF